MLEKNETMLIYIALLNILILLNKDISCCLDSRFDKMVKTK